MNNNYLKIIFIFAAFLVIGNLAYSSSSKKNDLTKNTSLILVKNLLENNQFENALPLLTAILKEDPQNVQANGYLGELYLETKQFTQAEACLEVLKKKCVFTCEEFTKLNEKVKFYKKKYKF